MILDVFQCSQLFSNVFIWVVTFMDSPIECSPNENNPNVNSPLGCSPNRHGPAIALVAGQENSSNQNMDYYAPTLITIYIVQERLDFLVVFAANSLERFGILNLINEKTCSYSF